MRTLIVGNGGREHALLWKLRRDHPEGRFFATSPNGGMRGLCEPVGIAPNDIEALAGWAAGHAIDLTVVGPEAPLAGGIVDRFQKAGLPVFGPTKSAARIEASKAFSKALMEEAGVPTAAHRTFQDPDACEAYVRERGAPIVVKASGLAAGKGAIVCATVEEAVEAAHAMLVDHRFGEAGREVVVEEHMEGEELSIFGLSDGEHVLPLLPSQDHKRIGEGDTGPNTGGMGAYAPVSVATDEVVRRTTDEIFLPTLRALAETGSPFRGLLYAGLMLTDQGPKVVEFNCRFGDPETQVVLPMMRSSLLELLTVVAEGGSVRDRTVAWREGAALTTVVASGGYPGAYERGLPIELGPEAAEADDVVVFHAGTAFRYGADGGRLVTDGGRVLACTGLGDTLADAAAASRRAARAVRFEGARFRRDIGWRELERERPGAAGGE